MVANTDQGTRATADIAFRALQSVDAEVERWYGTHRSTLERYVRSLVREPDDAADVCQETFVRLLVAARSDGMPTEPGAWVHRVAHNLVISNARRRQTGERALVRLSEQAVVGSTEDAIVGREGDRRLAAALGEASADDRTAMLLAAQGFHAREIGARIGRTELAARTLLCRARGRLRDRMLSAEAV